jgi:hypothetical protein
MDTVNGRHRAYAKMDSRSVTGSDDRLARFFVDGLGEYSTYSTDESELRDVEVDWF